MDLAAWTVKLMVSAALLGGFPPQRTPPDVEMIGAEDLAARFCAGRCHVRGAYLSGEGVLLADSLDLDHSPYDRSILLHELVHFIQDETHRYADESECDRWRDREIEAYAVQERYLDRYNLGVGNIAAALEVVPAGCLGRQPDGPPPVQLYHDPRR